MESQKARTQMGNAADPEAGPPLLSPAEGARLGDRLYSIGHSHHTIDAFLALLRGAGVTAVADVRSSPFSRRLPHFNRPDLEAALGTHEIAYVFLGDQLGGRPTGAELFDERGAADYERVRRTPAFREGLARLIAGLERFTVAVVCAEEDPLDCHRGLMIAPALAECGIAWRHLRKDGTVETMPEFEDRLLRQTKLIGRLTQRDLFAPVPSRAEVLAEAYRIMAAKKAYRLEEEEMSERP
jgi:hypothetical protein